VRTVLFAAAVGAAAGLAFIAEPASGLIARSPSVDPSLAREAPMPGGLKLDPETRRGKLAFESRCQACHSLGAGAKVGPDLAGVTLRRTDDWLSRWLASPRRMSESDAHAKSLVAEYKTLMPELHLSKEEVRTYIRYLHWFDTRPAARSD